MKRYGSVVALDPAHREEYLRLHAEVWPAVRAAIGKHHIHRHSIFILDDMLFRCYEYDGPDHEADMAALAAEPLMQEWAARTDACQRRVAGASGPSRWAAMSEICYLS